MSTLTVYGVRKSFGSVEVLKGIDLEARSGEFIALVGPSGCGKSTLLAIIAGLEKATSGDIFIADRRVNSVAPKDRNIAMVFQSYALYPTMTVRQNMMFGMEARGVPRPEREATLKRVSELLQIDQLLHRKPGQLSGGQRQRVAMGRALVRDPDLFLFDEPLSNLDAKLRVDMRTEIKKLHQKVGKTTIYVTHDQVEAMTLASRIAVLHKGELQQFDEPQTIYDRPVNLFVAGFMGSPAMNFIPAKLGGRRHGHHRGTGRRQAHAGACPPPHPGSGRRQRDPRHTSRACDAGARHGRRPTGPSAVLGSGRSGRTHRCRNHRHHAAGRQAVHGPLCTRAGTPHGRDGAYRCGHDAGLSVRRRDRTADRLMTRHATYPSLAGRSVLITGGASGIGADMVRAFRANGAKVTFLDIRDGDAAALTEETGARYVRCDLMDIPALQAAIAKVGKEQGPISVLINNAANDDRRPIDDVTEDYWDWSQDINLKHVFFAAQAVRPQMKSAGGGSIVNLSSIAWRFGADAMIPYVTAKSAVIGLTRALARGLGGDNIRVNAIEPGAVMTEKQRQLWYPTQASVDAMIGRQILKAVLDGGDIARMALFLAADDSRLITKQTFIVDAGMA